MFICLMQTLQCVFVILQYAPSSLVTQLYLKFSNVTEHSMWYIFSNAIYHTTFDGAIGVLQK